MRVLLIILAGKKEEIVKHECEAFLVYSSDGKGMTSVAEVPQKLVQPNSLRVLFVALVKKRVKFRNGFHIVLCWGLGQWV